MYRFIRLIDFQLNRSITKVIPFRLMDFEIKTTGKWYVTGAHIGRAVHTFTMWCSHNQFLFFNSNCYFLDKCKYANEMSVNIKYTCNIRMNGIKKLSHGPPSAQLQSNVAFIIMVVLFLGNLLIYHGCRWGGK